MVGAACLGMLITNDLPLHPIPVALEWDHLSDLKLADSNIRILVHIDLLLGAEVHCIH